MELGFNLLFLAIAAAGLLCWWRYRREDTRGLSLARGALVLGCALMLLFPFISITDDLCASSDAMEEMTISARRVHVVLLAQMVALSAADFRLPAPAVCHAKPVSGPRLDAAQATGAVLGSRAPPQS